MCVLRQVEAVVEVKCDHLCTGGVWQEKRMYCLVGGGGGGAVMWACAGGV